MDIRFVESILIILALSLNVFLVAEYEGSNLKDLNFRKITLINVIFFLGQLISMTAGFLLTRVPFFRDHASAELQIMGYIDAAVILLFISAVMLFRALRREVIVEKLRELRYKRILAEALAISAMTFFAGIAGGFLGVSFLPSFILVFVMTVAAVTGGLLSGYTAGCRFRKASYTMSFLLFLAAGLEVLLRSI